MSGAVSYRAGLAAEDGVERAYVAAGHALLHRRWRSPAGEIDLVFGKGGETVFVEVKRARDIATAAARLRPAQVARLLAAAELFLGTLPGGTNSPARFDVALVDGTGRVSIVENALGP